MGETGEETDVYGSSDEELIEEDSLHNCFSTTECKSYSKPIYNSNKQAIVLKMDLEIQEQLKMIQQDKIFTRVSFLEMVKFSLTKNTPHNSLTQFNFDLFSKPQ